MSKLQGSTVLLTGASGGIGRALVDELLRRGVAKLYAGVRNLDAQSLPNDPRLALIQLDVTDPASIAAAANQAVDVNVLEQEGGAAFQERLGGLAGDVGADGAAGCLTFTR